MSIALVGLGFGMGLLSWKWARVRLVERRTPDRVQT
jgi:hypothetical protein